MVFVRGVAQGECSKQTRMEHEKRVRNPKHAAPEACLLLNAKCHLVTS